MPSPYPSPVPVPPPRPTAREAAGAWAPACSSEPPEPPSYSSPRGRPGPRARRPSAAASCRSRADGQDVTGLPAALAVVGLAALVAVFAVRGAGRTVVAGAAGPERPRRRAAAPGPAPRTARPWTSEAAQTTGDASATVEALSHTAWPYVTAAGGLLILLAGLLALRFGSRWPAMSGRYERDGTPRPRKAPRTAPDPDRPEELWKALDRGEDPTREA